MLWKPKCWPTWCGPRFRMRCFDEVTAQIVRSNKIIETSPPISVAVELFFFILHALCQWVYCRPIRRQWVLCIFCPPFSEQRGGRSNGVSSQSLCALSRGCCARSHGAVDRTLSRQQRCDSGLFCGWIPGVRSRQGSSSVLMDGIAWILSVTQWRWTLAFVSWGISPYRFCPLCLQRRAHQSGSTIGKRHRAFLWTVVVVHH